MQKKTCKIDGCDRAHKAKGLCASHYAAKKVEENRKEWKAHGLCIRCGGEIERKGALCKICLEKQATYAARKRVKKRNNKICKSCPAPGVIFVGKNYLCKKHYFRNLSSAIFKTTKYANDLERILEDQNYRCVYTGKQLILGDNVSFDHKTAKARNGDNTVNNLQAVDKKINIMKNYLSHDRFLELCKLVVRHAEK